MKYSPKLKIALAEIKEVLDRHDIAGMIVLHTPGFSEYLLKLNASYSGAVLDQSGNLRVRIKTEDFDGDKGKRDQVLKDTVNLFHHLSNTSGNLSIKLLEISEDLDKHTGAEHNGSGHSSNISQNN